MKKIIIIFALFPFLTSCFKDEDEIPGRYTFTGSDLPGENKPEIMASFTLSEKGDSYVMRDFKFTLDGIESTGFTTEIVTSKKGKLIESMKCSNGNIELNFYDAKYLISEWFYVDSVIYKTDTERVKYFAQQIIKQ